MKLGKVALAGAVALLHVNAFAQTKAETPRGPARPIGHSLTSPEDAKRIAELTAKETAKLKSGGGILEDEADSDHRTPTGHPKAIISMGAESRYAIVVEKLHHRLSVYENLQGKTTLVKRYRAITGKQLGDKERRGDLKTPEGLYFITGKKDGRGLPAKYGPAAFTLDFPNIYDNQKRKTGSGIWIHGVISSERILKAFDTEGCVALANNDLLDLAKYLEPYSTPVVITSEITTVANEVLLNQDKEQALKMIEGWRTAWEKSDFDAYSSYYSNDFSAAKMNKKAWLSLKSSLKERRGDSIQVNLTQPGIVAFEDQLLALFKQNYSSSETTDTGYKFLYMKWEGDRYRILSEKWIHIDTVEQLAQTKRSGSGKLSKR